MATLTQHVQQPAKSFADCASSSIGISIVVPVAERYEDLAEIYRAHANILRQRGWHFEFIFVIDGGFHHAANALNPLIVGGEPIRVVTLAREFGESTALAVGFDQAEGDFIISVPAYFQVVPEGLAKVIDCLMEGYDLVVTRRWPRIDSWGNRLQNSIFHFLVRKLTKVKFRDLSCGLKGMKKKVSRELQLYGDLHRFLPLLGYQKGFRVVEIEVPQHSADGQLRLFSPGTYVRRVLDLFILFFLLKFTKKPLRFFGLIGASLFGTGFLISLSLSVQWLVAMGSLADRPLLILGVLLMVLGVQTGSIGLLGELIIFTHARKMKDYAVDKFLK